MIDVTQVASTATFMLPREAHDESCPSQYRTPALPLAPLRGL